MSARLAGSWHLLAQVHAAGRCSCCPCVCTYTGSLPAAAGHALAALPACCTSRCKGTLALALCPTAPAAPWCARRSRACDGKATPQGVFIVGRLHRDWRAGQPGKVFALDLRGGSSFGLVTIVGPAEVRICYMDGQAQAV